MKCVRRVVLLLCFSALCGSVEAAKLTITTEGPVSGAVGAVGQQGSNVCNPNPGGGAGGGTCVFNYPAGTPLRLGADSPNTPGFLNSGTGDASACATSTCVFTINTDSSIHASFGVVPGPYPSINMALGGTGRGSILTDNNTCQNWELGYSACTIYYAPGSLVTLQGMSVQGNIFGGFSGAAGDAGGCASGLANCVFTLSTTGSINASFAQLTSVAVQPLAVTINVGQSNLFSAFGTFANGATRQVFSGMGQWTPRSPMATARFGLAVTGLNNRVYAIGGVDGFCPTAPCGFSPLSTLEIYNPAASSFGTRDLWSAGAPMLIARESHAAVVANGKIYALGGRTIGGGPVASTEVYDPVADSWTATAPMPTIRAEEGADVINNVIYAVGGADDSGALDTLEAYDVASNTWTTKTPMTIARRGLAAVAVNGKLYAIAGSPNSGVIEEYDPVANTWTTKAPMLSGRAAVTAGAINGLIYVLSGGTGPNAGNIDVYNPASNIWVALGTMLTPRNEFGLGVLDGRLWAVGGSDASNVALATLEAFRPPETLWMSSNTAVGRISFNNGNATGVSVGTSTIRVRSVGIASGSQSATLTVVGGGGGTISLGLPNSATTPVGNSSFGCGSFFFSAGTGTSATAMINYGDGSGTQPLPLIIPPPTSGPCTTGGGTPTGVFAFNHTYSAAGTFTVSVTVTNTTTTQSKSGGFSVVVTDDGGGDNGCFMVSTNLIAGALPFTMVHMAIFDRPTGHLVFETDVPFGTLALGEAPAGLYRVVFTVPAGYVVTPNPLDFDGVCGQPVVLTAHVAAADATPPVLTLIGANPLIVDGGSLFVDPGATALDAVDGDVTGAIAATGTVNTAVLGSYTRTYTVSDHAGNTASIGRTVNVVDRTPPAIVRVVPSSDSLWPPNHKMVAVTLTVTATDAFDAAPACSITGVTSNETVGADGDWSFGSDSLLVNLRAERNDARVYSIRVTCTDRSGNSVTSVTTVRVDHSQGASSGGR